MEAIDTKYKAWSKKEGKRNEKERRLEKQYSKRRLSRHCGETSLKSPCHIGLEGHPLLDDMDMETASRSYGALVLRGSVPLAASAIMHYMLAKFLGPSPLGEFRGNELSESQYPV